MAKEAATNKTSDFSQLHVDQGLEAYKSGRLQDAYVEFLYVLAKDPDDPLAHYLCGLTLQALNLDDMAVNEWAAASTLSVRDGSQDNDWEWFKNKCNQFLDQKRSGSL